MQDRFAREIWNHVDCLPSFIDASTSDMNLLNKCCAFASIGECHGQRSSSLARANNDSGVSHVSATVMNINTAATIC